MSFAPLIRAKSKATLAATGVSCVEVSIASPEAVGDAIRFKRMKARISQQALCEHLAAVANIRIDQSRLSNIENGKVHVDRETLKEICGCLGCDTQDVLELAEQFGQISEGGEPSAARQRPLIEEDFGRIMGCIQGSGVTLWTWDFKTKELWISENVSALTGRKSCEMSRPIRTPSDLIRATGLQQSDYAMAMRTIRLHATRRLSGMFDFRCRISRAEKTPIAVRIRGTATFDGDVLVRIAGSVSEISDADFLTSQAIDGMEDCYVFAKDSNFRFTYVSKSLARLMGKPQSEIIGTRDNDHIKDMTQVEIFNSGDRQALEHPGTALSGSSVERSRLAFNEEALTVGGERRSLSTVKTKVIMPNGDVQMLGFAIDTTKHVVHDRAIDLLFRQSDDAIYIKDLNGKFIFANAAMARNLGLDDANSLIGKSDFDFFDYEFAEQWRDEELEIISSKKPMVNMVFQAIPFNDPESSYRLVSKYPVLGANGDVLAIVGCARDITDLVVEKQAADWRLRSSQVSIALNNLAEPVWIQDKLGSITTTNDAFESWLAKAAELSSRSTQECLHEQAESPLWSRETTAKLAALSRKVLLSLDPILDRPMVIELRNGARTSATLGVFPLLRGNSAVGVVLIASDLNSKSDHSHAFGGRIYELSEAFQQGGLTLLHMCESFKAIDVNAETEQ